MARKLNIPKDKQIKGIRKALANRKTPRAFIPSLKKRLAKLTGSAIFLLTSILYPQIFSHAQTPVSLVSTQQSLAPAGTACTGTQQTFQVNNRNQTYHSATLVLSGTVTTASLQIQGVDSSGNTFIISPVSQAGAVFGGISAIVNASGYYPTVNVLVTCASGSTFTLTYSGSQTTPLLVGGTSFLSLIDQQIFTGVSGASNENGSVFATPFGNSSGILKFNYASSPVAGSTVEIMCIPTTQSVVTQFNLPIASLSPGLQIFKIPPATCPEMQIIYLSGGAAGNITVEFIFDSPGYTENATQGSYVHITGTSASNVKATAGTLLGLTVNTPAVGTISIFDLTGASCSGTPSTNTVAVITATATAPIATFPYNLALLNGICVKASAAMDLTVGFQ
jgi:hypothetical protein